MSSVTPVIDGSKIFLRTGCVIAMVQEPDSKFTRVMLEGGHTLLMEGSYGEVIEQLRGGPIQ